MCIRDRAKSLFEACGVPAEQKELCLIPGCGHDDLSGDERYENLVAAFLDSFDGVPISPAKQYEPASSSRPVWVSCLGCFSHDLAEAISQERSGR